MGKSSAKSRPPSSLRGIRDGPFSWEGKPARRRIREACDATNDALAAQGVYAALAEIASDEQSEIFSATHAKIAMVAGASVRTVQKHIRTLSEIGLLQVSTPVLRAPSTYRMLKFPPDEPIGNDCGTFGNYANSVRCRHLKKGLKRDLKKDSKKAVPSGGEPLQIPDSLDTPAFHEAWQKWQQHRREIRKPIRPTSEKAMLGKLAKYGPSVAIAAVENSVANGWTGLFPERTPGQQEQGFRPRLTLDDPAPDGEDYSKLPDDGGQP